MNKIKLSKSGSKTDFPVVDPENTHHSWRCRERQTQISDGQHGYELVHGLMKAQIAPDDREDCAVPHKGHNVNASERDGGEVDYSAEDVLIFFMVNMTCYPTKPVIVHPINKQHIMQVPKHCIQIFIERSLFARINLCRAQ